MSLLDEQTALVDLPWLAVETVELLQSRGYRLIEIEYSERDTLACNVLVAGRQAPARAGRKPEDQSETSREQDSTCGLFPARNYASMAAAALPA